MKAVVVHQYGGPEVLKFEEYPDPVPGPGEVLVRVAATSVNPIDYKRRAGLTKDFYPLKFPGLIGVDIAGTVVKIGPEVEGFSVGDQVFAMADNTYAELCVVKAAVLVVGTPQNAAEYPCAKVVFVFSKFDRKTLEFMAEAVRDGKLVIPISLKLPLSEAAKAQAMAEKGGVGKILLVP
jgi:NADPH:quinone reductase-like Zn-dependent oxidoreductase